MLVGQPVGNNDANSTYFFDSSNVPHFCGLGFHTAQVYEYIQNGAGTPNFALARLTVGVAI